MSKKNNLPYIPYTYLIGWSKLDTWYYGSEYGRRSKIANPQNLWTTYFTSSKYVDEFREKYGEPDVIQVRKTFETAEETQEWEHKVLRRMKAPKSSKWLNKTDNKSIILDDISISKIVNSLKNKSEEEKARLSKLKSNPGELNGMYGSARFGELNPMYGKHHTDKAKQIISKTHIGKAVVKDAITGEKIGRVNNDHENIKNGTWVGITTGSKWSLERRKEKSEQSKLIPVLDSFRYSNVGTCWWNDGKVNIRSKESPGEEFVRGRLKFKHKKRKTTNHKWWTNGIIEKLSEECPEVGFKRGRIDRKKKD